MPTELSKLDAPRVLLLRHPLEPSRSREALPCRAGQWLSEVLPAGGGPAGWVVVDGGRVLTADELASRLLVPGDDLIVYPRVQGTVGKIVSGIIFPPLGVYWALRYAGLPSWASGLLTGGPIGMQFFPSIENIMAGKPSVPNVPTTTSDLSGSNTYGFGGIANGTRIGAPVPVVYGDHRVGGHVLSVSVRTNNNTDTLSMLLAVSEGPIFAISSIEINDQPIANYQGVSWEYRTGAPSQTAIGLYGDKSASTVDAPVTLTTTFAVYTTIGTNLNGFELKLTWPGGLFAINTETGKMVSTAVDVEVDYKLSAAGSWTTGPRVSYRDARKIVLRNTIRVDGLASGQYDIRVRRVVAESTATNRSDSVQREAVTELINDGYTYPNTALLHVAAMATNQLSGGLPRVTARVLGVKVKKWNVAGMYVYQTVWTNNPAWIVFDMLTNERYGHGRFTWKNRYDTGTITVTSGSPTFTGSGTGWTAATLRKGDLIHVSYSVSGIPGGAAAEVESVDYDTQTGTFGPLWWPGASLSDVAYEVRSNDLDIPSFAAWASFCDEQVPDGLGGTEARATCDFVFDADSETIWSAVLRICGIGQASAIKIGTYIRIKIEREEQPVQLFTMANIKAETFEEIFLPLKDRANIFEVQFLNRDDNYAQDTVVLEDPALFTNSDQPRRKTVSGYGITRSAHAARMALFSQKANRLVTRTISFEAALDAVACEPGDVIRFQHDIPQWGYGGRALAGSTSSTIVLDREVTLESGKTYEVLVRHADDTIETKAVTTSAGTVTTLSIAGTWAQTPARHDVWAFGETTISTKPFRIISIERTQDLDVRLTAVEYNAAVYDLAALNETNQVNYSGLESLTGPPGNVKNLLLLEQVDATESIWVSWSPPGSPHFKGARVYRTDSGIPVFLGESINGSFPISGAKAGELIRVIVTSVSSAGVESSQDTAPTAEIVATAITPPDVPTLVLEGDRLRWNYPNPPRDLAGFLVRFRPGTSRAWESATPAHTNVLLSTDLQIFRRQGIQTFLVKAVDANGNESLTAKHLTVSFDAAETENIVIEIDHRALGWPGTFAGASVIADELVADASAVFWTSDSALMWSADTTATMYTAAYSEMSYEFTIQPTADVLDATLKIPITMSGEWSMEYLPESSKLMWSATSGTPMWSSDSAAMWDALGDYTQWPGQLDHLRAQPYQIRVIGHAGTQQAIVTQLSVVYDVPDLVEILEDVPIASGGSRMALTRTYRSIVSARVTLEDDGGSAAYAKVMDKSPAGPLIQVFTTAGAPTTGLVDVVVHGY